MVNSYRNIPELLRAAAPAHTLYQYHSTDGEHFALYPVGDMSAENPYPAPMGRFMAGHGHNDLRYSITPADGSYSLCGVTFAQALAFLPSIALNGYGRFVWLSEHGAVGIAIASGCVKVYKLSNPRRRQLSYRR